MERFLERAARPGPGGPDRAAGRPTEPARWIAAEESRRSIDRGASPRRRARRGEAARDDRPPLPADARPDRPGRLTRAVSDRPGARDASCSSAGSRRGEVVRLDPTRARRPALGRAAEPGRGPAPLDRASAGARAWPCAPRSSPTSSPVASTSIPATRLEGVGGAGAGARAAPGVRGAGRALGDGDPPAPGARTIARPGSTSCSPAAAGSGGRRATAASEPRVAFVARDFAGGWPDGRTTTEPLDDAEAAVLDDSRATRGELRGRPGRGDGSGAVAGPRGRCGAGCARGLVDQRPVRPAAARAVEAWPRPWHEASRAARPGRPRPRLARGRRRLDRPEGRWSRARAGSRADAEAGLLAWIDVLLDRYGVLTREIVALDPWAPPWGELAALAGPGRAAGRAAPGLLRRGALGVQYADRRGGRGAGRAGRRRRSRTRDRSCSPPLDPANLYGAGAPLDIPLLEGGTARLSAVAGELPGPVAAAGRS